MDLLISGSPGMSISEIIGRIDNLVGDLAKGKTKYMGIIQLSPSDPGRRIDIRLIDSESYACGLLYFTGSKDYNITLRNKAIAKGWRLNEYSLLDEDDQPITANSEEDIHKLLLMDYLPPCKRN
jgi:DNA polymerase (family 10)